MPTKWHSYIYILIHVFIPHRLYFHLRDYSFILQYRIRLLKEFPLSQQNGALVQQLHSGHILNCCPTLIPILHTFSIVVTQTLTMTSSYSRVVELVPLELSFVYIDKVPAIKSHMTRIEVCTQHYFVWLRFHDDCRRRSAVFCNRLLIWKFKR